MNDGEARGGCVEPDIVSVPRMDGNDSLRGDVNILGSVSVDLFLASSRGELSSSSSSSLY